MDALLDGELLGIDGIVLTINKETRTIENTDGLVIGVEEDEKTERIHFNCPKIVGDDIDLTTMNLYVNYQNANSDKSIYLVDDVVVNEDETITFSWLLYRTVTKYRGSVRFIVCAKKSNTDGTIENEWNTTVAIATVLEGLEATEIVEDQNADVIEQILAKLEQIEQSGGTGGTSGTTDYNDLTNKPQIGGVELSGNKTLDELNIQARGNYLTEVPDEYVTETELTNKNYATVTQLNNKLDKNQSVSNSGKYLSVGSDGNITLVDAPSSGTEGDVIDVDAELKEYMLTAKPAIAQAIINKGGSVEDTDSLNDYATRISAIPNGIVATETLPVQTNLSARSTSTGIVLNWSAVANATGYLIIRKSGTAPQSTADGTVVHNGAHSEVTDTDVSYGNTYCYRIFPKNSANQYQSIEDGSIAIVEHKDRSSQTSINDLKVGDVIKFGQYGSSLLTWTICDTQDKDSGYVTVACNQHPLTGQFDASENNSSNPNPTTDRKNSGNNRWAYSGARQFLNTDGEASAWFTAQHDYDVRPSYYNQNGFLYAFTDYEKNIIVTKTNITDLATVDGGGSETTQDKIWLPSMFAMGLGIQTPHEDSHMYELYVDNASRSYTSSYWLRTINGASSAYQVRFVGSTGSLGYSNANSSNVALRPFCLLPTSAYTQWSGSDSAYIFADDSQRNT